MVSCISAEVQGVLSSHPILILFSLFILLAFLNGGGGSGAGGIFISGYDLRIGEFWDWGHVPGLYSVLAGHGGVGGALVVGRWLLLPGPAGGT